MRKLSFALIVTGALALGAPAALAQTVSMVDSSYSPASLSVEAGTPVTFTNDGSVQHNAVADDGTWSMPLLDPGQSRTITVRTPGTYAFYCQVHGGPGGLGMAGTLRVTSPTGPAPLPQTASPLPLFAAAGLALIVAGILLGRRTRTR